MRPLALALLASTSLSAPALANSVAPFTWTGFYVGVHAGYSWGSITGDTLNIVRVPPAGSAGIPNAFLYANSRDLDPDGALGGIHAGYNIQAGSLLFGIEADLSATGQRDTISFAARATSNTEDFVYNETIKAKLEYMGTVRGRIGYAFGAFTPFITGGLAWGHMKMDLNWSLLELQGGVTPNFRASFAGSQSQTLVGWTLGAGFEYAFAPQWSARAEYLYIDLGEEAFFTSNRGGNYGLRDHIARVGISYRVGP